MALHFDKEGNLISPKEKGTFTGTIQNAVMIVDILTYPEPHEAAFFLLDIESKEKGIMKVRVSPMSINTKPPHYLPRSDLGKGITKEHLEGKKVAFYAELFEGDKYWQCRVLMTEDK